MKLLLPIALFLAVGLAGCGPESGDPAALTRTSEMTGDDTSAAIKVSKGAVLSNLATNVILPALQTLTNECHALERLASTFHEQPSMVALFNFRRQWANTVHAWEQVPKLARHTTLPMGFDFWPVRPLVIEAVVVRGNLESADKLTIAGAATSGLFALEYLIFDQMLDYSHRRFHFGPPPQPAFTQLTQGENADRRRLYSRRLAEHLTLLATEVERAWNPQGGDEAGRFAGDGQRSLNAMVNRLLENLERVAVERLENLAVAADRGEFKPDIAPSFTGGISHLNVRSHMTAAINQYSGKDGPGIEEYLANFDPELAAALGAGLTNVMSRLEKLDRPIEQAVKDPALYEVVTNAAALSRRIEIAMKVDLCSKLGVTITFDGLDGD
ncbi:MAG: imelysin family protein [Verrucomicrobiae bacterium]|jgi:predicted lipoprotein|nr:imelysin family protein [Verrucomicrobiae bacterium]